MNMIIYTLEHKKNINVKLERRINISPHRSPLESTRICLESTLCCGRGRILQKYGEKYDKSGSRHSSGHSSKEQFHRQCIAVNIRFILQSLHRSKVFHCQTVKGHQLWIQGIYNEFCLFTEKNLRFWKMKNEMVKNRYKERRLGRSNRIRYSLQPKFKNNFT